MLVYTRKPWEGPGPPNAVFGRLGTRAHFAKNSEMGTQKMDLSHLWQQHIFVIKGRYYREYRPMLYAAIVALGSLPSVSLSSTIAVALYTNMLLPLKR
jgi:hypothetical protein